MNNSSNQPHQHSMSHNSSNTSSYLYYADNLDKLFAMNDIKQETIAEVHRPTQFHINYFFNASS